MATSHETEATQLHNELRRGSGVDVSGAPLPDYHDKKEYVDEKFDHGSSTDLSYQDGAYPTDEEINSLVHVPENLPASAWLVAAIEFCERFTYYGISGIFQNYIEHPYIRTPGSPPGALDMGHQTATALSTFFQFWCYVTPIGGAIVADQYLGRYNAIVLFALVYIVGLAVLFATALPQSIGAGAGLGGFIAAIILIGLGTGGIKSNVAPLIADQYTRKKMAVVTVDKRGQSFLGRTFDFSGIKDGQRVIYDPTLTYQRIYMIFYLCINVGSLSGLATPYMERNIDFWSAYLLGFCMFIVGFIVLILGRKKYVVRPPQGSIIPNAFKCMWLGLKHVNMDYAKPSMITNGKTVPWNDHFVEEVKRALVAIRVFVFFPVFWVIYGQFSNNFVSQAAQMNGHGIPNDLMQNFDPISIIVLVPILDQIIYPMMQKAGIRFLPISRITVGFVVAACGVAYASILQHYIYSTGPCYESPDCTIDGVEYPYNDIHIAIQTPAYVFIGVAEIFLNISGLEYAYTKAPLSMKSFVQSMYLFTNAFGSLIGLALVSVAVDPKIMWMYAGLAIASTVTAVIFWFCFKHLNAEEDKMNRLEADQEESVATPAAAKREEERQASVAA